MTYYRDAPEFLDAVDAAAGRLGVEPAFIEKDYWLTQVLRELAASFPSDWIFKGGTSLSKGFGLIQRFSEDVDVLVLAGARGRRSVDALMRSMAERAAVATGAGVARGIGGSRRGVHRAFAVEHPRRRPTGAALPYVLLEMGVRGGPLPNLPRQISALMEGTLGLDAARFSDLRPFHVSTLHPGRTLIEKLFAIHRVATRVEAGEQPAEARFGRHLYDVHCLLGNSDVRQLLADRSEFDRIVDEADEISRTSFSGHVPRPRTGFATSPAFTVGSPAERAMRAAHESAASLVLGDGDWPLWEEVVARVSEHATLL